MAPTRKKKHALIWWMNTSFKDIVELRMFPKDKREVNAIAILNWVDHKTGAKTKSEAKILAVHRK